jgi:hypothetical protein
LISQDGDNHFADVQQMSVTSAISTIMQTGANNTANVKQ